MQKPPAIWIAVRLFVVVATLMIMVARRDNATVDKTTALSVGYTYGKGRV
jgi:hypothetical protein